ncbi:sensor histidine kinase [Paramaledivibacter caminithermalis]|jgi:signal transduction histidine kinase|uniref:histidine kinase n=1 Tax=Paramaledivibacter caminithermalis (strain DSM 15212 / CIP 107654 / DViRD3) TaxID=1121301 RepID=A0A1M6RKH1_PARC5|nr:sensor histidine kinase [Paramaledivibacter caminithermalis]SHK32991.1 Histidine kinase-, DNA gyrase B-, and HSP90-like ATPase [Paramaledivibacter caminithermalis DSM 15212]
MSIINYLKERWLTYIFIAVSFIFSVIVYKLDKKFTMSKSNAKYVVVGLILLFIIFLIIDYTIYNLRINKFKSYCSNNPLSDEELDEFIYPMDKEYGNIVHNLAKEYEIFKSDISTKSSEELEFITKWVHDIKVPISAMRLILESHDGDHGQEFYRKMDTEIAAIEQCIQKVFYHIKSNTFYNDYKISEIETKKLIGAALKGYSNFFSYKKINISISGDNYKVLTDEKWSTYIISQILSNAVKYTPVNGHISINTTKKENKITIQIRNSGEGILAKDIAQIFKKGYTSSKRNGMKATGYGMYLSKKLSDMLGHELRVESEYGKYAQFNLTFVKNETIYSVAKMS